MHSKMGHSDIFHDKKRNSANTFDLSIDLFGNSVLFDERGCGMYSRTVNRDSQQAEQQKRHSSEQTKVRRRRTQVNAQCSMAAVKDFFTKLVHSWHFGPNEPTSEHHAQSMHAEALYMHTHGGRPVEADDASAERPRHGKSKDWQLQRCLVSTLDTHQPNRSHLRVVAISDTHMKHEYLRDRIPAGDVLIHCGDILLTSVRYSEAKSRRRIMKFNQWLGQLPHKHKIVIAGNHDGFLQSIGDEESRQLLSNATYLRDSGVTINGLKIYGSPVSWGHSKNDAFQQDHEAAHLSKIPHDVDLLVTHGFPFESIRAFRGALTRVQPKVHFCGHWHHGSGIHFWKEGTVTANCSMLNGKYRLAHRPVVVDVPLRPQLTSHL